MHSDSIPGEYSRGYKYIILIAKDQLVKIEQSLIRSELLNAVFNPASFSAKY